MKKTVLCALLLSAATLSASAQQVYEDNLQRLKLHYETPSLQFASQALDGQKYASLTLAGYSPGGQVGSPALPVLSHYIATPFCSSIEISVQNAVYDTLQLTDANFQFYPLQAPRSKSHSTHPSAFNHESYSTDAFFSLPLAAATPLGIERDRNLAQLTFAPVSVNPVSRQVIVCRSADITVSFTAPDPDRTLDHYRRHHTPSFATTQTLNNPFAKVTTPQAPVSMLIVAGNISGIRNSHSLQQFADWKRTQGLLVEIIYSADLASNTTSAINSAITQRFLDATDANPAPTYIILIGDHEQLPAYNCNISSNNFLRGSWYQLDNHVTDHYYTTWTNDNLRDCFLGRFSVTDTNELNNIVSKTLLYERYQFADDSYLGRAALISGIDGGGTNDNDNAWRCADPTMDYIARHYTTDANGFNDVVYYKNNTSFVPSGVTVTGSSKDRNSASALRNLYNEGLGWINYSAHGFENGWGNPSFTNSHVSQMTNNGKPSFMIGNCCLTNFFNNTFCFGEALLRKGDNAGAIGYIGGTNSTFWDEDFYFAVGVRSNLYNEMNPSYDANNLGAYDRLFHTHGESFLNRNITAGAMVHSGLMSVNSQAHSSDYSADMVEYYWEIYELMGDPSLMPWLGRASDLTFGHVSRNSNSIEVEAEPYAYIALVDHDLSLIAAAYVGATGSATLEIPDGRDLSRSFFSVTAQNRKPFTKPYSDCNVGIESASIAATMAPNPATDRCTVEATGLQRVQLLDLMGRTIIDQLCADRCTLNLEYIPAGIYLVRSHTAEGIGTNKLIVQK